MTADLPYILRRLDDAAAELATAAAILSALHEAPPELGVTDAMRDRAAADVVRWSEELRAWAGTYGRASRGESYACPHVLDLEPEDFEVSDAAPLPAPERVRFPGSTIRALDGERVYWPVLA